jgi:hypothetical protein
MEGIRGVRCSQSKDRTLAVCTQAMLHSLLWGLHLHTQGHRSHLRDFSVLTWASCFSKTTEYRMAWVGGQYRHRDSRVEVAVQLINSDDLDQSVRGWVGEIRYGGTWEWVDLGSGREGTTTMTSWHVGMDRWWWHRSRKLWKITKF